MKLYPAEMPPEYYDPIAIRKKFPELSIDAAHRQVAEHRRERFFRNDKYQVAVRAVEWEGVGKMVHLSIKRSDREPIHDWRDLQEIKNALVGPECEGVELYPAESRLYDTANQFHLWVFVNSEIRFPFGFHSGRHVLGAEEAERVGAKQRERKG